MKRLIQIFVACVGIFLFTYAVFLCGYRQCQLHHIAKAVEIAEGHKRPWVPQEGEFVLTTVQSNAEYGPIRKVKIKKVAFVGTNNCKSGIMVYLDDPPNEILAVDSSLVNPAP